MKKIITILMLVLSVSVFVNAQELTSKNGVPILPEKGEWALGIDAVPFFYYFGNMFNGNMSNGAPSFDFTGNYSHDSLREVYGRCKNCLPGKIADYLQFYD